MAAIASIVAGFSRGIVVPIISLVLALLAFWASLFLGSEIGYQKWQAIPNPPDEAFADTMPLGALLAGWIPATIFCGLLFGATRLSKILFRRKKSTRDDMMRSGRIRTTSSQIQSNPYHPPESDSGG